MGYELRRMIRDGAPPEWSPLMRLVASEIADDAGDPVAHPLKDGELPWSAIPVEGEFRHGRWRDGLTERCGMSARAVSRVLADLAAAGYEMRQPITGRDGKPVMDKRGRLVFAAKGHALRFVVPPLVPREQPQSSPEPASFDGQSSPDLATNEPQRSPEPASITPQRSPLPAAKVAEFGDPISPVSPQSLSPHKNQSPQPPLLAAVAGVEAHPVAVSGEGRTDSAESRQCGYAQCRIRTPVPAGRGMHEGCERFAALKAQAARPPVPFAVPA
ncbi:MAG TPA: hypothetical protein VFB06_29600 [Streptosporangiaceae bacterium]|nr:hypothetical protein [Streptosporangiaceae bacterium]